ncbi:MAG TPA: hypothetical protein VHV10_02500 [Ktedonobacteraceae bacterium]|jgi:hypothetical protein|nr:hypothetical protein [Ktedonobacteraceae bacterium]
MNTTDITTTLECCSPEASLALARAIDARMVQLASIHTTAADIEFLVLQKLAIPLLPYILQVEQERELRDKDENRWML